MGRLQLAFLYCGTLLHNDRHESYMIMVTSSETATYRRPVRESEWRILDITRCVETDLGI